ncbi:Thiamine-monophosphate kinase [Streptomyces afghaniensis]
MPEQLAEVVDPANDRPAPLRDQGVVVMGHGGGGALSAELMEQVFTPAYGNATLAGLADSAVLELGGARLAFSTDSYVVRPLFFPGGSLGDLAVNGTVNDLAMSGARPAYLSAAFVLEEGVELTVVERIARAMGAAAETAGVTIATGDTKVVESGHGDGVYVTTAGVGLVPDGVGHPAPACATRGRRDRQRADRPGPGWRSRVCGKGWSSGSRSPATPRP